MVSSSPTGFHRISSDPILCDLMWSPPSSCSLLLSQVIFSDLIYHLRSSDFIWYHLVQSHMISFDFVGSYPIRSDLNWSYLISSEPLQCYQNILSNPILSNLILFDLNQYLLVSPDLISFIPLLSSHLIAFSLPWWLHIFDLIWSYPI